MMAFTQRGVELAVDLAGALRRAGDEVVVCGTGAHVTHAGVRACTSLADWCSLAFARADALLFVGACGIAVRAIAPHVRDKFCDPAVVCVDEAATFAVPLLGGHVAGANDLARRVADACGAQAVVTTATDVRGVFAFDAWAAAQGVAVLDRAAAKEVSATLLAGGRVGLACDVAVDGPLPVGVVTGAEAEDCEVGVCVTLDVRRKPFARTLRLVPRVVVVGVGCRRGVDAQVIGAAVNASLDEAHVPVQAVCALATIDRKADEPGLRELAAWHGWELRTFRAERLRAVPGDFAESAFVREQVGVGNVCERAACATGAQLLLGKRSQAGVTVAIAATEPHVTFASETEEP